MGYLSALYSSHKTVTSRSLNGQTLSPHIFLFRHPDGQTLASISACLGLRQTTYLKVLQRFNMLDCRPISTPMDPGAGNTLMPSEDQDDKKTITCYQSVVGPLMWPAMHTRPDIAYTVGVLSRYCSNPGPLHCKYLQRIMRYISSTLDTGLVFRKDTEDDIVGYSDSDYAGTKDGRSSTGDYKFLLAGAPISYRSKLQPTVALSTCEAEYMALTEAAKEAICIANRQFSGSSSLIFLPGIGG